MSQTSELHDHLLKQCPDRDFDELLTKARGLVRAAKKLSYYNEVKCNRPMKRSEEREEERLEKHATKLLVDLGISHRHNGDPRGYSLYMHFTYKGKDPRDKPHNTWGGAENGWGIG